MQQIKDIREYKNKLRQFYKSKRFELSEQKKHQMDTAILERMLSLYKYNDCDTVFTYVSTSIEVDTRAIITSALKSGKKVAVPRCVPNTREMEFYYIKSFDDLQAGSFSVDEPNPDKCERALDFSNSICIVPGLCFDKSGYRLGYGKGYYDRFLTNYDGTTVGLCYSNCIRNNLIYGKYDCRSDIVVTEKQVFRTYL